MRLVKLTASTIAMVCLLVVPVYAAERGNVQVHQPSTHATTAHSTTTTHGPSTHGPSTHGSSAATTKGPSVNSSSHKTDHPVSKAHDTTTKHETPSSKSHKDSTTTSATGTSNTSTTTSSGVSPTSTVDFAATPVGQKLTRNDALRSKIETRLAAGGYTGSVYQAAYGFKNLGQFVAATNVSHNLGLSFEQLKLQMTGLKVNPDGTVLRANLAPNGSTTFVDPAKATQPAPTKSLGQAIQTVKPGADATAAQTATTQANAEIGEAPSGSTTTKSKK
jgi:hypothetical protein